MFRGEGKRCEATLFWAFDWDSVHSYVVSFVAVRTLFVMHMVLVVIWPPSNHSNIINTNFKNAPSSHNNITYKDRRSGITFESINICDYGVCNLFRKKA